MDFREPSENEYLKYKEYLQCNELTCENSFLNAVMWKEEYQYRYAICNGSLIIRITDNGKNIYFLPIGGNFEQSIKDIIECEQGNPLFCASDGERFEKFKQMYGDEYSYTPIEESFEYIYSRDDLADLSGKKFHQKRNHISAFSRKYNWKYKKMAGENICDALTVAKKWASERDLLSDETLNIELHAINRVLNRLDELEIVGGILYVDEVPVAFSFGSALNDFVFDVNIEKALSDYPGAYAVINNQFAKNELLGYQYINREDDLGIEGLRKAKLSYHPEILLKKYLVIKK